MPAQCRGISKKLRVADALREIEAAVIRGKAVKGLAPSFGKQFKASTIILVLSIPVYLHSAPGECALDFLNIPPGAHGASIGQGGYARIIGPQAIFFNPAALPDDASGFASYQNLLLDMRAGAAAAAFSLSERLSVGVGIDFYQPGDIDGYTENNIPTGNVGSGDHMIRLGLRRKGVASYGLSISYYSQRLDDVTGRGFGIGMGVSSDLFSGRVALTADNIGPDFKIGSSSSPLPSRFTMSYWQPLKVYYVDVTLDLSYRRTLGWAGAAGLEYSPVSGFFIRAGTSRRTPVSLGLGLSKGDFAFDYSFLPSDLFGDRHIFSFVVSR